MSTRFFDKGRQNFASKAIDWINDTIKGSLVDLVNNTDTAIKAITGATNATPIVITSTAHGFSNGDIVVIGGIVGNTTANGTWKIANVATNTFELTTTTPEALNAVGNGAYSSGGWAINLTLAQNYQDVNAAEKSVSGAFAGKADTNGVLSASDPTFTAVANGSLSQAMIVAQNTATPATDKLISFHDGKHQVIIAAAAATSDTTLKVEPLEAAIPNGTVLVFSNGISATLTAQPAQFARTITVSALSGGIAVGHTADAPSTASPNFPISGNGGNITVNIDTAANKLAKL